MRLKFSELKVAHKLMLMSIFFLLPDSAMLSMLLVDIRDNIEFARQEIRGNQYLRPLVHLLHLLPEYQRSVQAGAIDQAKVTASQIDQCLVSLNDADRKYGQDLQFTDAALSLRRRSGATPASLIADWNKLRPAAKTAADFFSSQSTLLHLLATVRIMITHAGDMSNLILDPDLDAYYLMDATLLSLPQGQDQLDRAINDGTSMLRSSSSLCGSGLSRMHAAILRESAIDHVLNSVNTALREDGNFHGVCADMQRQLPPARDAYLQAVTRFITLTDNLDQPEAATITADQYKAAGIHARAAGLALWEVCSRQLDNLLMRRINAYQHHRNNCIGITAMAILSATLLVSFINRSINRPVQRQADALREANLSLKTEVAQRLAIQAELLEASHCAGMAEIAVGVLHNVGNVLNSVNTSATVIREKIAQGKLPTLTRAAEMIQQHRGESGFLVEDPRGRQLPDLLSRLVDVMTDDSKFICDELRHLDKNIDHVKQIVQSQQTFARHRPARESTDLAEAVEDAVRITGLWRAEGGIELVRDFQPCAAAMVDKHKLLQTLVNLINNAKNAVLESRSDPKRITLTIKSLDNSSPSRAQIVVVDSGVGIPAENLGKIFQHGFTTRTDGHGFGLHASAIDIHQMGGSITVASPGRGKGAVFTLEIPLHQADPVEVTQS